MSRAFFEDEDGDDAPEQPVPIVGVNKFAKRPFDESTAVRDMKGRFAPGHPGGPGRHRRPSVFQIAVDSAAAEGFDLQASVWRVCKALLAAAEQGDVQAARTVLDRLCDTEPVTVAVAAELGDVERQTRLRAILQIAAARTEDNDGTPA